MSNYPPNRGRGRGRGGATENGAGNFLNGRGRGRGRGYVQGDFGRGRGRGCGGDRGGHGGRGGRGGRGGLSAEDRNQIMIARREETLQVATTEGTDDVICAASAPNEQFQKLALSVLYRDEFEFHDCWSVRRFINSCLVNLSNHHSIDVSQLIPALAAPSGITRLSGLMLMPMITDGGNGGYTNTDKLSFQYDVLPLVGVLTREKICMATLSTESNAIYNAVYNNRIWFFELGIIPCFSRLIANGSIEDKYVSADEMSRENSYACTIKSLQRALLAVVRLVFQLVKRIREARLEMAPIVEALVRHAKDSRNLATSSPTEHYLSDIVYRELGRLERMTSDVNETSVSSLQIKERARPPPKKTIFYNYDPPGELSVNGIRHGNDKVDFSEISILPRIDEITCQRTPFLPANGIPEAPHYLEPGWRRQLDIHFRLYREDLIDSLRKGILGFMELLDKTAPFLEKNLLKPKELRKSLPKGLFMKLYKVTEILQVDVHRNEGTGILISFEQPAQIKNSTPKERKEFWERNKNRLASGGLVSLIRRANLANRQHNGEPTMEEKFEMHLAIVMGKDNELLAKNDKVAKIRITSSDSGLFSLLFESDTNHNPWYLVESSGGFYEAFKPILMALQKAEPATLPFGRYLAPTKQEIQMNAMEPGHIAPPIYATAPGFRFDLSVLLKGKKAKLDVRDAGSIKDAVSVLQTHSTLDSTQAEALVETLCREVALISGPPGTGKTKIGVDLMQVLLHNRDKMRCGPIVCICYTNHALDQFLEHLLDIGEKNIVRIGARSKSERLDPYTLQNRKQLNPHNVRKTVAMASEAIEIAQEKILRLGQDIKGELPWKRIRDHISLYRPELLSELQNGPPKEKVPPRDKKATPWKVMSEGELYHEWISCTDIKERVDANQNIGVRLKALGFGVLDMDKPLAQYTIPKTNRVVGHLRNDIWEMSEKERGRLLRAWKPEIYRSMQRKLNQHIQEVNRAIAAKRAAYDDASRQVLQNSSVIGMTTNGAAKMNELISSISPKIIICEEAGEVLESHILSALSPSTQHLILIGDHLQLRPQIENYELSMDSKSGKLYKLDQSLFERLVTAEENPLPMSKLTIQRRMRPEISSLIRTALYPHLADGDKVREYPPVTGMRDSLYFMDHDHPEDGKDQDGSSYSNKFEVQMIEALAFYLIKNGYDKEGDIAVLTPYLGQLSKLRDGLGKSFAIMLDERDQDLLDKKDEQELKLDEGSLSANGGVKTDVNVKKVSLQRHLTLRTIDNYQGEEAKIVIISLVRNRTDGLASSIGFLRSPNRTNVLLSRAQHGMFLLGNASLMESKKEFGIWPTVINELRENDRIGEGFRLRCKNHPDIENVVVQPSSLKQCAPNGGCIRPCGYNMECGHVCPLQCKTLDGFVL
ncbi:hypothetical protein BGW38_005440 [Lunasporangiospora selenospora]|uniref:AAA domain-containing protein n=1 Tax=Lunasporangiospora selenospora TaxID=979761 RepID=A0A9P6G0R3_9FUNG|nr:hypothetical protein BGW38_005440 [Lunasporangiospora selenospora]